MKRANRTNLQIRGIPVELHDRVRRNAAKKGQTMSEYVMELIRDAPDRPSLEKWLDEVRRWKPIPIRPGMSAAQAVREAREERAEHLARNAEGRGRSPTP